MLGFLSSLKVFVSIFSFPKSTPLNEYPDTMAIKIIKNKAVILATLIIIIFCNLKFNKTENFNHLLLLFVILRLMML